MPAIITHYLVGEEVLEHLDLERVSLPLTPSHPPSPAKVAFLWGCQGPDPFFFAFRTSHAKELHALGTQLHTEKIERVLDTLRREAGSLALDDRSIALAYALGYVCHFGVDSTIHPYVFAKQKEEQKERGIEDEGYVHGVIEAALDVSLLHVKTGLALADTSADLFLPNDAHVLRVIARLYRKTMLAVFGVDIPTSAYRQSLSDMRTLVKLLRSKSGAKRILLSQIEKTVRRHPYSMAEALSHVEEHTASFRYSNQDHLPWTDPFSHRVSTASYFDLVDTAVGFLLDQLPGYLSGDEIETLCRGLDFHGESHSVHPAT